MKSKLNHYKQLFLTFAFIIMSAKLCFAQIEFTERIIADNFRDAHFVYAIDVDEDGDMDVIGAGQDGITWWENDGDLQFTEHAIESEFYFSRSLYVADVDLDGDIDILGAGGSGIAWYENDEEQSFTEHIVAEGFGHANGIHAIDFDGDSDVDVLGTFDNVGIAMGIAWWENNGEQEFSEHIISNDFILANGVCAADIDSDGDLDVLGGTYNHHDGNIWWENDGEQGFTEHALGNQDGAHSIYVTDIDEDGDMDVFGGAWIAGIFWHENDGEQAFTEHRIGGGFGGLNSIYLSDIDADSDLDVIAGGGEAIAWFENDGEQGFTEHIIANGDLRDSFSVFAIDIDNDGDMDVLEATQAQRANKIVWWESDLTDSLRWQTLPDTTFAEDSSLQLSIEYFTDHIISLNFPDSALTISVENGEHVFGEINNDSLIITADHNWNGIDELMLIATDPDEHIDTTYQRFTVTPVNDPPENFDLTSPEDGVVVDRGELVTLRWNSSIDPDLGDDVSYMVRLIINDWFHPNEPDTMDFLSNFTIFTIRINNPLVNHYWWVYAISGNDTTESDSRRSIYVRGSGDVKPDELTIHKFQLSPAFPNPFNGQFSFDIQLPQADIVKFHLYDVTGRSLWSLSERLGAGIHRQNVDLNLNSAGVYFLKAESSFGRVTERVVMLK